MRSENHQVSVAEFPAHRANAIAVFGIALHGKEGLLYSTVDLANKLERAKRGAKAGRITMALLRMALAILEVLAYMPFTRAGGTLLFHLLSKPYEHASVAIITNPRFSEWSSSLSDDKITTALPDRLTHHRHIVQTGSESYRSQHSGTAA